ncbi:MAG: GNAT family N-acetyltransferase [Chloroflexota bacterium]|nr:GNAT family N-acetyltransferase [Chloroflexota bacterium]
MPSDNPPITIRRAGPADEAAVLDLLEAAAAWLWARGVRQWQPGSFTAAAQGVAVPGRVAYLAEVGGQPVGTFALQWADPDVWGARPPDAGYLHSLAVARAYAGQGVGAALLDAAAAQVRAAGRTYLRLDCWAGNAMLRGYYAGLGFTPLGEAPVATFRVALFERAV